MLKLLTLALLTILLAGCPAVFTPTVGTADGVTLTQDGEAFTITTTTPVDRAFLRFIGAGLTEDSPKCVIEAGAVECTTGAFTESFTVNVGGVIANDAALPYGIVCVVEGCFELFLE